MLVLDLIERRQVIRQRAFAQKRIVGGNGRRILHGRILSGDRDSRDLRESERYKSAQRHSERIWEKELSEDHRRIDERVLTGPKTCLTVDQRQVAERFVAAGTLR